MTRFLISIAALVMLTSAAANAADFTVSKVKGGYYVVLIEGDIVVGDDVKFDKLTRKIPSGNAMIGLISDGGSLGAGLNIGITIRSKRFVTLVSENTKCLSVCAFAWLAGVERFVTKDSYVGFHGAFKFENDKAEVSGAGNAVVGAYLARLGFSYDAIYMLTKTKPDDMLWMTGELAQKLGIKATILKSNS
jgi:hypothetical protein